MRPYIGYVIAWSMDGTRMLAFARDYDELYDEMNRRGIKDFVGDGSLADGEPFPEVPTGVAEPVGGDRS